MTNLSAPDSSRGERLRLASSVMAFGIALGATTVAFPLLALEAGYGAGAVGLFAALSALLQMLAKMTLPYLYERVTDRLLMLTALLVMALSASVLLVTTALIGFVMAQVLQGVARGIFWTSGQTHAVRLPGIATRQLGFVQSVGQFGGLVGPALAGTLAAISLYASLWAAIAMAALGFGLALTLMTFPTYERAPRETRTSIWRTPGVGMGSWAGAVGGTWRGILDSFVPVILEGAGFSSRAIGWLMSIADAASLSGTAAIARWGSRGIGRFIPHAALSVAAGLVLLPHFNGLLAVILILALSGLGGGVAGVLSTATVNESVDPGDQGAALALVGAYRAGARSAAPALISGALQFVGLPVALAGAAVGIVLPSAWLRHSTQATVSTAVSSDSDV